MYALCRFFGDVGRFSSSRACRPGSMLVPSPLVSLLVSQHFMLVRVAALDILTFSRVVGKALQRRTDCSIVASDNINVEEVILWMTCGANGGDGRKAGPYGRECTVTNAVAHGQAAEAARVLGRKDRQYTKTVAAEAGGVP